jgi:hypothetical protein
MKACLSSGFSKTTIARNVLQTIGILFVGKQSFKIVTPGIVRVVGSVEIGGNGTVRTATNVLMASAYLVSIAVGKVRIPGYFESKAAEGRAVLTYNAPHFVPLVRSWYEVGQEHARVILSAQLPPSELLRPVTTKSVS